MRARRNSGERTATREGSVRGPAKMIRSERGMSEAQSRIAGVGVRTGKPEGNVRCASEVTVVDVRERTIRRNRG